MSRRRAATLLDVTAGALSLAALGYWNAALIDGSNIWLHAQAGSVRDTMALSAPGLLWAALACILAWRGQTVGHALLGLRWVNQMGHPARWRPLGEPGFWCLIAPAAVAVNWAVFPDVYLALLHIQRLVLHTHTYVPVAGLVFVIVPAVALAAAILFYTRPQRRSPALLMRRW